MPGLGAMAAYLPGHDAAIILATLPPDSAVARDVGLLAGWQQSSQFVDRLLAPWMTASQEMGPWTEGFAIIDICRQDEPSALLSLARPLRAGSFRGIDAHDCFFTKDLADIKLWDELASRIRGFLTGEAWREIGGGTWPI